MSWLSWPKIGYSHPFSNWPWTSNIFKRLVWHCIATISLLDISWIRRHPEV